MPKIMLDAGHYGKYNRSPAVEQYYESDMSWSLHLLLKAELEKYGIEVGVTRADKDTDLEVYRRGKKAKGYDMFISLHSNASGSGINETCDHPIVYRYSHDTGEGDTFARNISGAIAEAMSTAEGGRVGTRVQSGGAEYYGVLRGAAAVECPHAYIFEHSFHTATKPTRWLMQKQNLELLAKKEAEIIADFYGINREDEMTKEDYEKLEKRILTLENQNKVYHYYTELPAWAREQIQRLHREGKFAGNGAGDINLDLDLIRILVILANNKIL